MGVDLGLSVVGTAENDESMKQIKASVDEQVTFEKWMELELGHAYDEDARRTQISTPLIQQRLAALFGLSDWAELRDACLAAIERRA